MVKDSEVTGIIINKATAKQLLETDILEQIQEELAEANDLVTVNLINQARSGKAADSIDFETFCANQ